MAITPDIRDIRSRAFAIYKDALPNARNRAVAGYGLKRKMLQSDPRTPAGLIDAANILYKHLAPEDVHSDEAVIALLYLIHNLDCMPDKLDHGLEDDLLLIEYTLSALNLRS